MLSVFCTQVKDVATACSRKVQEAWTMQHSGCQQVQCRHQFHPHPLQSLKDDHLLRQAMVTIMQDL
jgi:hypothetical protein